MDLDQFLRQRQPRWEQLTALLDRVERAGLSSLSRRDVHELFSLYRLVSSDLNLAQTRTANPALLEYLEKMVGRAYAQLVVPRQRQFFRSWWRVLRHDFPAAIRAEWAILSIATAALLAGIVFGFAVTMAKPVLADTFLGPEHLEETPHERVERLEALERSGHTRIGSAGAYSLFSTFLFTHNIKVAVLGFALGFTFGIGTIAVLFSNGAMLGSLAALYLRDGVMVFFLAWVGPHGVIELPCVIIGCAAGLMIARAQFRRDRGPLRTQMRDLRPRLLHLLIGTASLLVIAGLVEGGFSQINEPTLPYVLKISVAVLLFIALVTYLFFIPVNAAMTNDQALMTNE